MKKRVLSLLIILVILAGLAGCKGKTAENTVKIGSKDFTESFIVAELYALALEQEGFGAVSYTHLDVYKRQGKCGIGDQL